MKKVLKTIGLILIAIIGIASAALIVPGIALEELLNRTSFQAYKNMPLFLRLGFAVGIFEKIPSFQ